MIVLMLSTHGRVVVIMTTAVKHTIIPDAH